jgi:puromycin-sensitive aminopeptidase
MSKETTAVLEQESQTHRLPKAAIPERYEIKLTPDLTKFTFSGEEIVYINVKKPVNEILVNASELTIAKVWLEGANGAKIEGAAALDEKNERAILNFAKLVEPGAYKLFVVFEGILNDKLHGFYRSFYKDENGKEKVIATTQFEATDARKAFPCWDEPEHKAVYAVTLVIDENLTAISNASIKSEKKLGSGKKEVVFNDTIKMSTYLVAFIIGDFVGSKEVFAGKTPIRIWSVPGKQHMAKFAEDIAVFSTNFFAKYYGIDYPGDKMDLIAIPDFASGAMENLGAITFRETALLVDEKTASHAEMERVADVVAHEIAHMWFGDLVTMKWWNGIWLNEAFATFAEMLAVDNWKPNWKRWESFGVMRATASAIDGLKSTRPIEFPVNSPDECSAMFDVLTYEKGASVLRMLEQYIGADVFAEGVSLYLKKHEYGNAETTDLWDGIEEASKEPVRQMMDTWIFQEGYPMINVDVDADGKKLTISQQRFFYLHDKHKSKQLFHVPIMLKAKTDKGPWAKKFILNSETTTIDLPGKVEWVVLNEGGHAFYRVAYSARLQDKLVAHLSDLAAIERFNLVNDSWAATVAGITPLAQYVKLIELFADEKDKNVWSIIIASLSYLYRALDSGNRAKLADFTSKLLAGIHAKLGFEPKQGEDELTGQLRGMLIAALGTIGNDKQVQSKAKELYGKYEKDRTAIDPNVAQAVVSVVAFAGDEAAYNKYVEAFKNAKTPQDEQRFLFALAEFQNEHLLKKTLELTINGEVRTQNAPYVIQKMMMNAYARNIVWDFVKKNWKTLVEKYPPNTIPRMCEGVTCLVDAKLEKEVEEFFAKHEVKQGGKTIDQHLERLKVAVAFKGREEGNTSKIW